MKPIHYLRSRSLPLLALVEAARVVFGSAGAKCRHSSGKLLKHNANRAGLGPGKVEPFGDSGQLRLEGLE